jgi:hypothetical protein
MDYKNLTAIRSAVLITSVLAVATLTAGCKPEKVESHWATQPVHVDGQIAEWGDIPLTYFKDSDVQLGLCNDSKNLYVLFCFYDARRARVIRMGGLTVWLDNSGKKNKVFGLRYTGGPPLSELQESGMAGEREETGRQPAGERERFLHRQALISNQLTIIDKERNKTTTVSADGSSGPIVSAGVTQDLYTYEFSIPLQSVENTDWVMVARPGQAMSLGFEWGGMGDRRRMMEDMGGDRAGGGDWGTGPQRDHGGGRGGPGGGWGRGGPGGGGPPQPPEKQEVWVSTILATPPSR